MDLREATAGASIKKLEAFFITIQQVIFENTYHIDTKRRTWRPFVL
jgi:hypothetical protein